MITEELTNDREQRESICECGGVNIKIMSAAGWDLKGGGVYRSGPPEKGRFKAPKKENVKEI